MHYFKRQRILLGVLVLLIADSGGFMHAQEMPGLRIHEARARELFQTGLAFFGRGQYVASREFFYQALDIQPYFHLARRFLGDAYYYSGQWDSALDHWELINEISEGYPLIEERISALRFDIYRRIDPGEYIYLDNIDSFESGYINSPVDTAFDQSGNSYILSYNQARIYQISPSGNLLRTIRGSIFDRLSGPIAMEIYQNLIYVSDFQADRVRVFNLRGGNEFSFGGSGSEEGLFRGPSGIAVTDEGIFVADSGNRRIQKFNFEGEHLVSFGADGAGILPTNLTGLTVSDDVLYAIDADQVRILLYDLYGNYLESFSHDFLELPRSISVEENRILIADQKTGIWFLDRDRDTWESPDLRMDDRPLYFLSAFSMQKSPHGLIYVSDYRAGRVYRLIPEGLRIANFDMRIEKVDTTSYPDLAIFLRVNSRDGRSITGLDRDQIFVYENDREMVGLKTDNMDVYQKHLNISLVKENSQGFGEEFQTAFQGALQGLLDPLRITDEIEMIRIGDNVRTVYKGRERRVILRHLIEGEYSESPDIGRGIYDGITARLESIGPRAVVVVLSGRYYENAFRLYSERSIIQYARAHDIPVHIISYELEPDENRNESWQNSLKQIANRTGGNYIQAYESTLLQDLHGLLASRTDSRYIITYRSRQDRNLSDHYVDVRVEVEHLGTGGSADGGYFVP